eukprot:7376579-Prymnesium_polylepis.1
MVWRYYSGESLPFVVPPTRLALCLAPQSGSTSYSKLLNRLVDATTSSAPADGCFPRCRSTSTDEERPCRRLPGEKLQMLPDLTDRDLAASAGDPWLKVAVVRNPLTRYPSAYQHYKDRDDLPREHLAHGFECAPFV